MYWENKGKLVPTRELIKTPEQIEGIRRAGVVNTGVLDAVAAEIHAGMSTLEIDKICRQYCEEHNAIPACLGYEGFPMSVCTSINEVVCHGIPKAEDVLEEGDIIKVKIIAVDEKNGKLKLSRKALLPKPEGYTEEKPARAPRREGGDRGPRREGGDRGPRREGGERRRSDGGGRRR
jgi:hypothetical protein